MSNRPTLIWAFLLLLLGLSSRTVGAAGFIGGSAKKIVERLVKRPKISQEMLQTFLAQYPQEQESVNNGFSTFLDVAAMYSSDRLEFFLNKGVSPNMVAAQARTFPLASAVEANNFDSVHLLLRKGARVDQTGSLGRTALFLCSNPQMLELLLISGSNINAKDSQNNTPLHVFAEAGNVAMVEALVRLGADISLTNNFNQTPLDLVATKLRSVQDQDTVSQLERIREILANPQDVVFQKIRSKNS